MKPVRDTDSDRAESGQVHVRFHRLWRIVHLDNPVTAEILPMKCKRRGALALPKVYCWACRSVCAAMSSTHWCPSRGPSTGCSTARRRADDVAQCGGQNVTGVKTALRLAPALRGLDPPGA